MEFNCEQKEIQTKVLAIDKIVATRSTLPIIGNLLFEAKKDSIKISANNLEMGMELTIPAKVTKEGAALVPAKTLAGIVSKLPGKTVKFKALEKGVLKISYSDSFFTVHTLPPDEFPALTKIKEGKTFSLDPAIFVSMVKQTVFAVSTNEDKYALTGLLLETGKSTMPGDSSNFRLVATDGYRLAKRGASIELDSEAKISVIVPAKALQEMIRILEIGNNDQEIKITVAKDQISFKQNDLYLVSRLIQGQFPDYKQVFPKKASTKVTLKTSDFLAAAERAAVVAQGSANIVRFEAIDGSIHLIANTPDVGSIDEVIEAEVTGVSKFQIAFNVRLITDMLKTVAAEKVVVELTETLGPGLIRGDEKADFVYIVMPIRTQETA